jgi:hypothetical protein
MKKRLWLVSGLLTLTLGIMLALTSYKPASVEGEGYATMTVYENFAVVNSKIIITYPDEQTEIVELGPFKYNNDYLTANSITVNKTLNGLREKGYHVVSMTASGKINSNKAMRITTIILEKN